MVLFARDRCRLRPLVAAYKEVQTITVRPTGRGPKMDVKGVIMDLPVQVRTLPSLLDGQDLYVGEGPIMAHLKKCFGATNA